MYVTAMGFSRPIGSGSVLPIVTIDNVKESTNKQPVQEPEPDTHEPMTLHWASDICQNREKLRQALASGIDINARDAEVGATALHIMATLGRVEAVRNLLEAGADPNIRLSTGKSTADVLSHNIQHDTGRGKETAEQILQLLQNASQQTKGTTPGINITKCRFWVCLSCTSVLEKMNLEQDIIKYSMPGETLEGRRCECPNCHRSYRAHDVYTGKYDLPREAWTRMQARDGRPIEVTVRKTTEGCFIATSCYGSYDHPAVREFRWFRDHNLIKCPFGRQMVAAYYRTSPSLATFLTQRPKLAAVVRQCILNPIRLVISNLHKKNIL